MRPAIDTCRDDIDPIPVRPPEPPGPPPKRRLTVEGRVLVGWAIVAAVFLVLAVLVLVPSPYGVSP